MTDLAEIEAALAAARFGPLMVVPPEPNRVVFDTHEVWDGEQTFFVAEGLRFDEAHLIANAPAWLAELLERVKAAEAEVERLRSELQDFADFGARHDTTPTIAAEPDVLWWYDYIQSMDRGVRERAARALNHTDGVTPGPVLIGEVHRFTSANSPGVDETTPRARAEDATEPILRRPTDQRNWDRPEVALIRHMGGRTYARVGAHKWTELPKFGQVIVTEDLVAQQHEEIAVFTSPRTAQRYEPPADDHESGCCR